MTGGNPAKKGMRIMTQNVAAQKRTVATSAKKEGLSVQDLILVAVLIAAGAVLKLTVSSFLSFAGMKPNFMIAMYCLAIILTRPKVYQSVAIGLLVGLVSQLTNSTNAGVGFLSVVFVAGLLLFRKATAEPAKAPLSQTASTKE